MDLSSVLLIDLTAAAICRAGLRFGCSCSLMLTAVYFINVTKQRENKEEKQGHFNAEFLHIVIQKIQSYHVHTVN